MPTTRVRVVHFPLYSQIQALLPILDGIADERVTMLHCAIVALGGTRQERIDWRNPDDWIGERLQGDNQALAATIWQRSNGQVNPRHMLGGRLCAMRYELLEVIGTDLRVTPAGQDFTSSLESAPAARIDEGEGLFAMLRFIDTHGPTPASGILPDWLDYLERNSCIKSPSYATDTLHRRLRNLLARELIERERRAYTVTPRGLAWLAAHSR